MSSAIESITNNFKNMDETFVVYILSTFTIFVVIMFGIYFMYMYNLQSNECDAMNKIYSTRNASIQSVEPSSNTLSAYCIKSAYNCCSLGSYKNDYVGTCILTNILQQGVRFLDFEIFSIDDMPVVATSVNNNYHEKETFNSVDLNEVFQTIMKTAFNSNLVTNYKDPIIIHLRFKSNNTKMFDSLLSTLQLYDDKFIGASYSISSLGFLNDTPLSNLMGKISIIVDDSNKTCVNCTEKFIAYINMKSNSDKLRIHPYYNIRNATNNELSEMERFNEKNGMTICIPDKDSDPPNPNLQITQQINCNIVAMRYQHVDDNLILYNTIFKNSAFILKPDIKKLLLQQPK